jgi:hypothetical protein
MLSHAERYSGIANAKNLIEVIKALRAIPGMREADNRASFRFHSDNCSFATYPLEQARQIKSNIDKILGLGVKAAPVGCRMIEGGESGFAVIELNWGDKVAELKPFTEVPGLPEVGARSQLKKDFEILQGQSLKNENGMTGPAHWYVTPDGKRIIVDNWDELKQVTVRESVTLDTLFFPSLQKLVS